VSEQNSFNAPFSSTEFKSEFYESFYGSVLDDLYQTFDGEKRIIDEATTLSKIAEIDPIGVTSLLNRAVEQLSTLDMSNAPYEGYYSTALYFLADALARANQFDTALQVLSKLEDDDKIREENNLFAAHRVNIPEPYLERAAISFVNDAAPINSIAWLSLLGESHPAIRPTALVLMRQTVDHGFTEQEQDGYDRSLQMIALAAAKFEDIPMARETYNKIPSLNGRIIIETTIANETGIFLEHDDFEEIRTFIKDSPLISPLQRVGRVMQLDEAQSLLANEESAHAIQNLANSIDVLDARVTVLSRIALTYNYDPALQDALQLLAELDAPERSDTLNTLCYLHGPTVLARCIPETLSILIDDEDSEDKLRYYNRLRLSRDLIIGLAQSGQTEEALVYFDLLTTKITWYERENALRSLIIETARKGREHLDQAVSLISRGEVDNDYKLGRLFAAIAIGGDAYLSASDKEMYITAASEYMSCAGLIELAVESNNVDYLVRAKAFANGSSRQRQLLDIAIAYQKITSS
jgi:hypothetical protein